MAIDPKNPKHTVHQRVVAGFAGHWKVHGSDKYPQRFRLPPEELWHLDHIMHKGEHPGGAGGCDVLPRIELWAIKSKAQGQTQARKMVDFWTIKSNNREHERHHNTPRRRWPWSGSQAPLRRRRQGIQAAAHRRATRQAGEPGQCHLGARADRFRNPLGLYRHEQSRQPQLALHQCTAPVAAVPMQQRSHRTADPCHDRSPGASHWRPGR
ncbi:hypothetical protein CHL79_00720 [Delftia acidovorans]|nr:hypothetical protein CHL79_00720 [Delftia acidovorans]